MEIFNTQVFGPVIGLSAWELIVAACNLLILYAILKKLLFKKVYDVIIAREKEVDSIYTDAENYKSEALNLKKEYESNIQNAKDKAHEIVSDAQNNASKKAEAILHEAQEDAKHIKEKAYNAIELEKKHVRDELHREIVDLATLAASKVLGEEIDSSKHKTLISNFIEQVGE